MGYEETTQSAEDKKAVSTITAVCNNTQSISSILTALTYGTKININCGGNIWRVFS